MLRSSYNLSASWLWFDVGPYGSSGHAHRDKLSLVLHARESMLLVDSGRFAYSGTDLSAVLHRGYASNTSAHNTLLIDGCDQQAAPAVATAPLSNSTWSFTPEADTVQGSMSLYDGLKGAATHTRAVYYRRGLEADDDDWVVVVDVVSSTVTRNVTSTWHAHPNATGVAVDDASGVGVVGGVHGATGTPTQAQVCVVPSSPWGNVSIVRGQMEDRKAGIKYQGWYSQTYDDAWAASVLVYTAVGVGPGESLFVWLLVPSSARKSCAGTSVTVVGWVEGGLAVQVVAAAGTSQMNVTVPVTRPS